MPYLLNAQGIQIATQLEQEQFLTGNYQQIYGQSIDLSSSTQDGQMLQIYVQAQLDVSALILSDYNSRDANSCTGVQLDTLFYWLPRQGGSFTIYGITVVTSGPGTLYGTDQTVQPASTIQDAAGNQYELQTTTVIPGAGTQVLNYEAANPGAITSPANSINVPVTTALFVTSYNNASGTPVFQGQTAETDFAYRIRGLASQALPSQGFFDSLYASLGNVPQAAKITLYENFGDTVSPNSTCSVAGVPAHGIWAIVQGSATPQSIATAIYNQRTDGCNMRGLSTFVITKKDGSTITMQWDYVTLQSFFYRFTATSIDGVHPPNLQAIISQLPGLVNLAPGAPVNVTALGALVQQIDPNTLVTNGGVSLSSGGPFTNVLSPSSASQQLVLAGAGIIATPMVLLPTTSTVAPAAQVQFTGYGGTQTGYSFSMVSAPSGGSVNASSGLYTAGPNPGVDTVKVTDSASNTATATVTVT